ncbi:MAG: thioredoxin [Rickettsiales bacterium]|nr:thioredoxin [Rickettsiales bacterium]|tara:strand:+ start:4120 stop:4434 length:315 start_codon:yes stop_codon:yes gene_type:complete
MIEFTDSNFDAEVINSDIPVLVDFAAVWCGPCKAIAPTVSALADDYAGRVKIGKMDIDENPSTPVKYHVRAVPTLILFKGGKPVNQVMGAVNRRRLEDLISSAL